MEFTKFFEMKYLDWQREEGGRKTVRQLAAYIGVSPSTISSWWTGDRIPEGENIAKIADKFGMEVYDSLGLIRPDPLLFEIQQLWGELSPKERENLRKTVTQLATKKGKNEKRTRIQNT